MSVRILRAQALDALKAACAWLGENPELVAAGACPNSRGAYHAIAALKVLKPNAGAELGALAAAWGMPDWSHDDPLYDHWAGLRVDHDLIARIVADLA